MGTGDWASWKLRIRLDFTTSIAHCAHQIVSLSLKCRQLPRVSPLQVDDDTRPHSDRGQGPGAGAAEAAASCYYDLKRGQRRG